MWDPASRAEAGARLKRLKNERAAGKDEVTWEMIKSMGYLVVD